MARTLPLLKKQEARVEVRCILFSPLYSAPPRVLLLLFGQGATCAEEKAGKTGKDCFTILQHCYTLEVAICTMIVPHCRVTHVNHVHNSDLECTSADMLYSLEATHIWQGAPAPFYVQCHMSGQPGIILGFSLN